VFAFAAFAGCAAARGAATDAAAAFDWTLGNWHGVRRAAADGSTAAMTVRVEPLADGIGQVEILRVEGTGGAAPYVAFTVRSFDAARGRWSMTYANSPSHAFARLLGEVDGPRAAWTSPTSTGSRLVSERLDDDHLRKQQFTSADGGRTWTLLFTDELERNQ
jgi:hypothetical protein